MQTLHSVYGRVLRFSDADIAYFVGMCIAH